jgi:hypothetical protein
MPVWSRCGGVAALVLASAALAAADAHAGAVTVSESGGVLTITGTPAQDFLDWAGDDSRDSADYLITPGFATTLTPQAPCVPYNDGGGSVHCPRAGITSFTIDFGDGDDGVLMAFSSIAGTVSLGPGDDRLEDDGGADDVIDAGDGADRINPQQLGDNHGNDRINGGPGDDHLTGHGGTDRIDGGPGTDAIDGLGGDDIITGGDGTDILDGGAGNDTLDGGADSDILQGGFGDDTLIGGPGSDTLQGQQGADRIDARDGGPDRIDCGEDADVVALDVADMTFATPAWGCEHGIVNGGLLAGTAPTQRAGDRHGLIIQATCAAPCRLLATAGVRVGNRRLRYTAASAEPSKPATTTLALTLRSRDAALLRRASRGHGRRPRALVSATAQFADGTTDRQRIRITLRR